MSKVLDDKAAEIRQTLSDAELERSTEYTFADAIRLGGEQSKQAFGAFETADGAICAMSAGLADATARGYAK